MQKQPFSFKIGLKWVEKKNKTTTTKKKTVVHFLTGNYESEGVDFRF